LHILDNKSSAVGVFFAKQELNGGEALAFPPSPGHQSIANTPQQQAGDEEAAGKTSG
jgi:hypothetical protein